MDFRRASAGVKNKSTEMGVSVSEADFNSVDQTEQFTARSSGGIVVTSVEILGSNVRELIMCLFGCCLED